MLSATHIERGIVTLLRRKTDWNVFSGKVGDPGAGNDHNAGVDVEFIVYIGSQLPGVDLTGQGEFLQGKGFPFIRDQLRRGAPENEEKHDQTAEHAERDLVFHFSGCFLL